MGPPTPAPTSTRQAFPVRATVGPPLLTDVSTSIPSEVHDQGVSTRAKARLRTCWLVAWTVTSPLWTSASPRPCSSPPCSCCQEQSRDGGRHMRDTPPITNYKMLSTFKAI